MNELFDDTCFNPEVFRNYVRILEPPKAKYIMDGKEQETTINKNLKEARVIVPLYALNFEESEKTRDLPNVDIKRHQIIKALKPLLAPYAAIGVEFINAEPTAPKREVSAMDTEELFDLLDEVVEEIQDRMDY